MTTTYGSMATININMSASRYLLPDVKETVVLHVYINSVVCGGIISYAGSIMQFSRVVTKSDRSIKRIDFYNYRENRH